MHIHSNGCISPGHAVLFDLAVLSIHGLSILFYFHFKPSQPELAGNGHLSKSADFSKKPKWYNQLHRLHSKLFMIKFTTITLFLSYSRAPHLDPPHPPIPPKKRIRKSGVQGVSLIGGSFTWKHEVEYKKKKLKRVTRMVFKLGFHCTGVCC